MSFFRLIIIVGFILLLIFNITLINKVRSNNISILNYESEKKNLIKKNKENKYQLKELKNKIDILSLNGTVLFS
jgi:hypothetical protein